MNSTENIISSVIENEENIKIKENTENGSYEEDESEVMSVTQNISKVRLTLEEIIANDNEASRQQYLSSPKIDEESDGDDGSSVSSRFESDRGSIISTSSSGIKSINDTASIMSAFKKTNNDAFRGVDDDYFSNLDRYGFLQSSAKNLSVTHISEKEYMEKERLRL